MRIALVIMMKLFFDRVELDFELQVSYRRLPGLTVPIFIEACSFCEPLPHPDEKVMMSLACSWPMSLPAVLKLEGFGHAGLLDFWAIRLPNLASTCSTCEVGTQSISPLSLGLYTVWLRII